METKTYDNPADPVAPILSTTHVDERTTYVVVRCPWCGELHQHRAVRPGYAQTRRAVCGMGRYWPRAHADWEVTPRAGTNPSYL